MRMHKIFKSAVITFASLFSLSAFGYMDGGLDYFITLRSSSLSHGTSISPNRVDTSRLFQKIKLSMMGKLTLTIPRGTKKVVIDWGKLSLPQNTAIPSMPDLKINERDTKVGNFTLANAKSPGSTPVRLSAVNPVQLINAKATRIDIDWNAIPVVAKGVTVLDDLKLVFNISQDKEMLFKQLVSKIPMSSVSDAFKKSGNDYYASVFATLPSIIHMYKGTNDNSPYHTVNQSSGIQMHYILEKDIEISAVSGKNHLYFGKIALPSDKSYWVEVKPQNASNYSYIIDKSFYNITDKAGKAVDYMQDFVVNQGTFAAFKITGAPQIIKDPEFSCGMKDPYSVNLNASSAGALSQSFLTEKYESKLPLFIDKDKHVRFWADHQNGYTVYNMLVGGKVLISKDAPSGSYRSDCKVNIIMG